MVKEFKNKIADILGIKPRVVYTESRDNVTGYVNNIFDSVFNGDKFPGSFGQTKSYKYVDYYELRERSMQLFTENPYAKGLIKRLIRNEIGNGLTLEAAPITNIIGLDEESAQAWADEQEINWNLWGNIGYICDFNEQKTIGELASDSRMNSLISGDCLVILRINPKTNLPCVELIDGTHIKTPMLKNKQGTNEIIHGVEIDAKKRHVAYWIQTKDLGEYIRIPAWGEKSGRRIAWLIYGTERRLDDVRGEPLLACMLYMLKELDRYRDSEQRAALVNSLIPMFIIKTETGVSSRVVDQGAVKRGDVDVAQLDGTTKKWNWGSMLPGTVPQTLAKGEEPVSFNTQRPNANYGNFEEAILNVLAWNCEVPPEIMRLLFQSNFSASRQANNEFNIYLAYRYKKFGIDFYSPIYIEHTVQSVLLNYIEAPGLIDAWWYERNWRLFGAWVNSEWTGVSRPSVDMLKDVNAATAMIDAALTTQDQQCRKLSGMSYKTIIAKRKREIDLAAKMGVTPKYGSESNIEPAVIPEANHKDIIYNMKT